VSAGPNPPLDTQVLEQERRRLGKRLDEVARMCEANLPPATFYGEMLKRLLESLAAPAGVVWTRTAQGNLQQQFQINAREIGLDRNDEARQSHEELIRQAVLQPRPLHLPPQSGVGPSEPGKPAPGNPTDYLLLLVPIMNNEQVAGLVEVWQAPNRPAASIPGFLQYMALMADLCVRYQRNQMLGQMTGQQQLWTQLEAFTRQIHGSLHVTEVAYLIANEGRRLIECDRVSVAVRRGKRTSIEAVSGADVVERRSNLVRLMRKLCDEVLTWGEKLVFTGTKDDALPPNVLKALDEYLAESPSQLLVVLPLHDEREGEAKSKDRRPPRAAVLMEAFEAPPDPQQLTARLEVVGKHAVSALYNAVEYQRIPMRFIWSPLAKLQEGLGGKARAIWMLIFVALSLVTAILLFVPYPLKMDATGRLEPHVRRIVYAPHVGIVDGFDVWPGDPVKERRVLARMHHYEVRNKIRELEAAMDAAEKERVFNDARSRDLSIKPDERADYTTKAGLKRAEYDNKKAELENLMKRVGAQRDYAGSFLLTAPEFTPDEARQLDSREWTVLNGTFREEWVNREAKPSEPILRLGAKDGPWEIELKIPQKHIGQILRAYKNLNTDVLEVDFIVRTDPTRKFKGMLERGKISGEANPNKDDNNESEPVVIAFVSVDHPDIPADYRLDRNLQVSGTEVNAKVRCGPHRMGYSLFYGVWEFLYEKVVFFF
jgi:hypothetical protein